MDEATRKAKEEEDLRKKKERERIIWDGHTASAAKTKDTFHTQFSLDDQIRHMHQRMGLTEEQGGEAAGPKIGPAVPGSGSGSGSGPQPQAQAQGQGPTAGVGVGAGFASLPPNPTAPQEVPPALAAGASTPGGGTAYEGATISAPPSGPSAMRSGPPSSGGAPPGIHPARAAMMGAAAAGSATPPPSGPSGPRGGNYGSASPAPAHSTGTTIGQTRPAPDSGEYGGGGGPAKRAKVEKLAFGQYSVSSTFPYPLHFLVIFHPPSNTGFPVYFPFSNLNPHALFSMLTQPRRNSTGFPSTRTPSHSPSNSPPCLKSQNGNWTVQSSPSPISQ